jgi:hypothetical protein
MTMTTPDWAQQRGGEVRLSKDGQSASVYFAGSLQYVLVPIPAKGQHSVRITETINGRRVETGKTYPSAADALRGGLDELRAHLGW